MKLEPWLVQEMGDLFGRCVPPLDRTRLVEQLFEQIAAYEPAAAEDDDPLDGERLVRDTLKPGRPAVQE